MSRETPGIVREILERVPPDYYEGGTKGNVLQWIWHGRKWRMLQRLLTQDGAPRVSEVLDVGCASGLTTSHVAGWFPSARVTGVDAYQAAVAHGSEVHREVGFVVGDAHKLPFASQRFDLITCLETLEHLSDPRRAVQEMKRGLRSGGLLVVVQDTDSLLFRTVWWVWGKTRGRVWDHAHVNPLKPPALRRLLEEAGFRIRAQRYTFFGMEVFFKAESGP